ncbi:NADH-ubiquinone oxidoreductase chain H [Patulibacter medicamentivorans]|uniref:NADH-quinone oxidoreductase subunit H n=2 Tax=Patulibacter medicamentivorans TaxID=1097667 RepID=H0E146_9ACTN|nr:NADH-quinone oxidoreductase subunit NuoH [Patulibacter medicamentivorans]EHN12621.1 NADH-ubiquinone oxidoreductase chain H [Patulibacter medicamentivorans]
MSLTPAPIAEVGFYEPWWMQIVKTLVIFGIGFSLVPLALLYERKLLGRFQNRPGPNRVGPFGTLQPMADIFKLVTKEQFKPRGSIGWLFILSPLLAMVAALATFALVPFSGRPQDIFGTPVGLYGLDSSIGLLIFFAFSSIGAYGVLLGGWSSGSKYSFLGAMRGAAQLISYEVSQGLALLGIVMTAGTLSLSGIVEHQSGMWFILPQVVGAFIFFVATLAEINRTPFDLLEADSELVAGYMTEYGGGRFALYYVAEYVHLVMAGAMFATLFLGGWQLPFGIDPPGWIDPIVVLAKTALIVTLIVWIRASLPKVRYDQLMSFGWKVLLPLATLNALVTAVILVVTDK